MRIIVAVLTGLAGTALAIYVAVAMVLIGGIENIVDGAKANPIEAGRIAWGLVEVCFLWELILAAIAALFWFVGVGIGLWGRDKFNPRSPRTFNYGGTRFDSQNKWPGF